jgi:cellobiose-specific phosphotransferase system component IIB
MFKKEDKNLPSKNYHHVACTLFNPQIHYSRKKEKKVLTTRRIAFYNIIHCHYNNNKKNDNIITYR